MKKNLFGIIYNCKVLEISKNFLERLLYFEFQNSYLFRLRFQVF